MGAGIWEAENSPDRDSLAGISWKHWGRKQDGKGGIINGQRTRKGGKC